MSDNVPSGKPDITEQTLYVPYSEDVLASVWAVDRGLQMFTNVPEELAQMNAVDYKHTHIYFFAELAVPESDEEKQILHRDADDNPETTVTENEQ